MNGLTYVNFPDFLTEATDITLQEKMTILSLLKHKHGKKRTCFPTLKTLGRYLGRSERSVSRYLKSLKEKGYIKIQNRGHKSNLYTILCAITWDSNTDNMVLLNESNCEENSPTNHSINSLAKSAMEKVNAVIKRNTTKPYNSYNYKNKVDYSIPKDEYSLNMGSIRQNLISKGREKYKEITEKGL